MHARRGGVQDGHGRTGQERRGSPGHPARARRSLPAAGAAARGRTGAGAGRRPARHAARGADGRRAPRAPGSTPSTTSRWSPAGTVPRRRPRRSSRSIAAAAPTRPSSTRCSPPSTPADRSRSTAGGRRGDGDDDGDPRRRRDGGAAAGPQGPHLVDGHAVVIVGYGRHDAFPGGGYLIVRSGWGDSGWGDDGDGYMPFTYVRAYATELCTIRRRAGRASRGSRETRGGDGPPRADRPAAGSPRLPAVAPRNAVDVEIDRQARCADPRASLTHLFFSDDLIELARARAICSLCAVREPCLRRALDRQEPCGVWGGELARRRRRRRREAWARPAAQGAPPAPRRRRDHRRCRWSPSPSDAPLAYGERP